MPNDRTRTPRAPWIGLLLALAILTTAGRVRAVETRVGHLQLDPHHTVVAFHVGATLHEVHGTFALESGGLDVDLATGAAAGTVIVDATSGESGNASRDARMVSAVLDGEHFPEMRFRAERVEGTPQPDGSFQAILSGVLTLHGDDHAITVTTSGHLTGDTLAARGHFTVPYVAWGLPDPSIAFLTVAPTVEVDVTTEGHVTWTHE